MEQSKKSTVHASMRLRLFATCGALLILMSALFTWLIYASFESEYKDMQGQYYALVTGQVISNVEDTLQYGKDLEHYYGMDTLLGELAVYMPEAMEFYILGRAGNTLYTHGSGEALPARYSEASLVTAALTSGVRGTMTAQEFSDSGESLFVMPIHDEAEGIVGGLVLRIGNSVYADTLAAQLAQMIRTALLIVGAALLLLALVAFLVPVPGEHRGARRLTLLCSLVLILAILVEGVAGYQTLQQAYRNTMMDCGNGIANYMGRIIEQVHEKGVPYDEMDGLSAYLAGRIEGTSLLWNMQLVRLMADTDQQLMRESQSTFSIPVVSAGEESYFIQFEISNSYMQEILLELFFTFFLTLIVMLVMMSEVNKLPQLWLERDMGGDLPSESSHAVQLRLITFLVFTANYLSIPYSAAVIRTMGEPLFGMTLEATASLPVTIEVFLTMAGMLLLQKRAGRFSNMALGVGAFGLLIAGNVVSVLAGGPLALLGGRAVCGVGIAVYKLFTNRVAAFGEDAAVEENIGAMNAGLLGGIMCGGSLGAIVSEALGNHMTYVFTMGLLALTLVMTFSILGRGIRQAKDEQTEAGGSALKLLLDRRVLLYTLAVILPLNVGLMFIVSFLPAFAQGLENGGLLTSYGYIVNGLAGIYLGQALVNLTKGRLSSRLSLCLVMLIGVVSLAILGSGVAVGVAALLASALMGLFDVYGNPVATSVYLRLPAVEKVNTSAALTTMMVVGSLAQTAAPMLFSGMIANMNTAGAMGALLPAILVLAADVVVIFLFLKDKGQNVKEA